MSKPIESRAQGRPLVSIGVPAYNAERFIGRALDSLLAQTLSDFEVIISDNASTDETRALCEDYARRDRRIRYVRQTSNIGAPRNWNFVVHEARGEFFKWSSASDYCSPLMLELCVKSMQADLGVVLCYGKTQYVDEEERPIRVYDREVGFEEERPSERFAHICAKMTINNLQCGLFRLDALRRTRLDRLYPSGDLALMAELTLYGRFRMLPEILLFRCESRDTSTAMIAPLERQRVYEPHATRAIKLILVRRYLDNLASIRRAPISIAEKANAYRRILRLMRWDRGRIGREFLSLIGFHIDTN